MFGLDERIATFSNGTTLLVVVAVSVLLGLRHAGDPDHLAAVTTMIASGREGATRRAARLGFTWGLGHGTSLEAGSPVNAKPTHAACTLAASVCWSAFS
jgi:high-affinity nickel permease